MNKAVIMAGGFGTRLRPITMNIPKPMAPILNKPMMEHIVNLLKKNNIKSVVSLLYFQPEIIMSYFEDGAKFGIEMNYVLAQADYGTAGSVRNAYEHLKNERFIIISGDVLTDFDLSKAIAFHKEKKSMATICLTRVTNPLAYGIVITDEEGKIVRFLEKPSWGQVFSDTINTGIYILEPEALEMIPYQEEFDFSKDLFPMMLKKNMPLYGYIADGYWKDVGNLEEYQAGQLDALNVEVNLNIPEQSNQKSIGSHTKVANNVNFSGRVIIGKNCEIGDYVKLHNAVIGNNVKVQQGTEIFNSTIWNDVEIGEFSYLSEDVVCNGCKIGNNVTILENVYIGDNCKIGSKSKLNPNIKLWPDKEVEDGATLSRSLVQEEKWLRELFTDARISGSSNIEINPEFAAKLGTAYGMTLNNKAPILASRDPHIVSRVVKRAMTAGLCSAGINVHDLQTASIPQTRQELRTGRYEGGFHVRRSPRNPDNTDIIIFNKDGRDITISDTKKIERYFFGEDIKRVMYNEIGKIYYPERTNEIYVNRFINSLDIEAIREHKFKLLIDYSYGLASTIYPYILGQMNVEAISLNDFVDPNRFHPEPAMEKPEADNTGRIMRSLNYELGFRIEPGAEKLSLIDERGIWHSHMRLLSIITKLFLETNRHREPYKIAVSVVATNEIEDIASEYDVEVIRIKNSHSAMMEATLDESVLFVGGFYGGFIFRDFLFASDAMYTSGKILEMLAKTAQTISQVDDKLPRRYQCLLETPVSWDSKGTVMRKAMEYSDKFNRELVEGIKIFHDGDNVLLLPAREKGAFFIYGESDKYETSINIAKKYQNLINQWKND